jgi:hypothetical protein
MAQFPHCDSNVIHAPGECKFCDMHPELQERRAKSGVNFTGHHEEGKGICPAEQRRSLDLINRWPGNVPETEETERAREEYFRNLNSQFAEIRSKRQNFRFNPRG